MTTPPEVGPWLTPDDLRDYAQAVEGGPAEARIEAVRLAVVELVEDNRRDLFLPAANDPDRVYVPTHSVRMGAVLLAARMLARRSTPLGVQSYGEFATAILRSDPDIGLMLGLGRNAKPAAR